ncbi:enoyl-CoA hydratase-related protein [Actinosynnema sp. NPDC020468]|uniref:enoyl-CoA hydratase/isomerase family protein n=1 Tax=Actinosynnema sp. NPDC020468 TaxID=3154488 RepID=UPI0033DA79B6
MSLLTTAFGPVAVFTVDRPEVRNALDRGTLTALHTGLLAALADPSTRAVVITGSGDRAFSAGLDLRAVATEGMPDPALSPVTLLRSGYAKPVVAAVNGAAVGGGFELALACDLRVAAEHAVFGLPEVSRGIAASEGGTDLPLHLPLAVALELGLTADPLTARRAHEFGLVNRVVPAGEELAAAVALATRIAEHSPAAVAATKRLMRASVTADPRAQRAANVAATAELLAGPDAAEGARAFLEKRPPRWA